MDTCLPTAENVNVVAERETTDGSGSKRSNLTGSNGDEQAEGSIQDVPISDSKDQARDADFVDHAISASSDSSEIGALTNEVEADNNEQSKAADSTIELEKQRKEMKLMEAAKHIAASEAQVVEETKVDSIKKDSSTEKLFNETIEKNLAEFDAQKEFYINALNAIKEAESTTELESCLRVAQVLGELQTLSRTEQQAVHREDKLLRQIADLRKQYEVSELLYNEFVTQVPELTQLLRRQIEIQETDARRAEAWDGVMIFLNSLLKEAEAKAAAAEEKDRVMNVQLSQSLSRITVLVTQIDHAIKELTQLRQSLALANERASEVRQGYLAVMTEPATQEFHSRYEMKDFRSENKQRRLEMAETELSEKVSLDSFAPISLETFLL